MMAMDAPNPIAFGPVQRYRAPIGFVCRVCTTYVTAAGRFACGHADEPANVETLGGPGLSVGNVTTITYGDGLRCVACLQLHALLIGGAPPRECVEAIAYILDGLDPGIRRFVQLLRQHGVETFQSCDGAHPDASYREAIVEFHGNQYEGFRALAAALMYALPVRRLERFWSVQDGEPVGPSWALTFWRIDATNA